MSFFAELKRRNVFRMAALYLVAGWVLLQVADVLAGVLGLPDWTLRLVAFLLLLGFPLALIFSWVYELTPEGLKRDHEVDRIQSITAQTGRKLNVVIVGLLAAAVTLLALDRFVDKPANAPVTQQDAAAIPGELAATVAATDAAGIAAKSIAVLPFVNMSADPDNAYFSDGLSEELLNFLAKVDGLKVAARTSSFQFRGGDADIAEIGARLKVATVLEGSVRKAGDDVRITAQLIEVDSGYHLWSETYDRNLDNIFAVQEEIARAIVDALKLPLLGKDAAPLKVTATTNVEAYDLYLLGRHHAREPSAESLQTAVDYYERAIAVDPGYALAHSGLADAYMFLSDYGDMPIDEASRLAEEAARRAMELDPGAAEPYASMGLILDYRQRAEAAMAYYDRALAINPNYVNALGWKANALADFGRFRDALVLAEQAYDLDPLSNFAKSGVINSAAAAGQFDRAETLIREMIAEYPDDPLGYEEYGNWHFALGQLDAAVPYFIAAHRRRPGDTFMAWRLVQCFVRMGDDEAAEAWYEEARRRGPQANYTHMARLEIYRFAGDPEAHLAYALKGVEVAPRNGGLRLNTGAARYRLGDLAGAESDLRLALELAGYDPAQQKLLANQFLPAVFLAAVLAEQGQMEESDALLAQIDGLNKLLWRQSEIVSTPYRNDAWVSAIRGDGDRMLASLEKAVSLGLRGHRSILRNPIYQPYFEEPGMRALIQKMKIEEVAMRTRLVRSGEPRLPEDISTP
ncbi:MAG: tetratricopeptide repeat protein [Chromatiales bacterium]|nr:tetratricopeptide repeat protein [Chromatiales bacterium]